MYFHLVYSPEFSAGASVRKSTRKAFRQATELMALIDHELVRELYISPLCPPLMLVSHGHIASFGEAAYRGVLGHSWVRKTQVKITRKHKLCVPVRMSVNNLT